ncbi:tetratricopeptide repeat protein [bacterium]|nr:tetratricopeptide repeat protein [bacterium]
MRKAVFILVSALLIYSTVLAESPHSLVKKGNTKVTNGELDEALADYLEAAVKMDSLSPELLYDLGGVFARKGNAGRADSLFRALPPDTRKDLLSRAHYNRGAAFAQQQDYENAVNAFIQSLQLNPEDEDAKHNLELSMRMMQQQQQQQQQQNQDSENQDENQEQEQQEKEQQEQQQQEEQQKQDQQQQGEEEQQQDQMAQNEENEENEEKPEEMPQPEPTEAAQDSMDKLLAERILDKLQEDEKGLLKKVVQQQIPAERKKAKKDW